MKNNILLTGGVRSGKSSKAEQLAKENGGKVLFVATAEAGDEDMICRIKNHQKSRPLAWHTLESSLKIGQAILHKKENYDVIVIDCLTMLTNNVIGQVIVRYGEGVEEELVENMLREELQSIVQAMCELDSQFIIVTNEVGLGIVPDNRLGRLYRDLLGRANQFIANAVETVIFMISGCELYVKKPSV
ncbi:MAG: bifunctional adenosylcobinamide kinase/adenosylcobinamide-phosphate guanylyltransferase [Chloroflexi bacterium]|nr:bifunctional adenosylcobinamide kinase/adenosylcobinamide-phosphate guanylyltransferase [Chloroflexota bacterium]